MVVYLGVQVWPLTQDLSSEGLVVGTDGGEVARGVRNTGLGGADAEVGLNALDGGVDRVQLVRGAVGLGRDGHGGAERRKADHEGG